MANFSADMILLKIEEIEEAVREIFADRSPLTSDNLLDEVINYIHSHYLQPNFSIKAMAIDFDLSVSYMSHYFKKHYGFTLTQYIDQLRINKIKELLRSGDMTLLEITSYVGYANASTLIRFFRKIENMTPGEYRKQLKEPINL